MRIIVTIYCHQPIPGHAGSHSATSPYLGMLVVILPLAHTWAVGMLVLQLQCHWSTPGHADSHSATSPYLGSGHAGSNSATSPYLGMLVVIVPLVHTRACWQSQCHQSIPGHAGCHNATSPYLGVLVVIVPLVHTWACWQSQCQPSWSVSGPCMLKLTDMLGKGCNK